MMKRLLLAIIITLSFASPGFAAQHDYDITTLDADSGVAMRAAINSALQALATNNLGATAPPSPYAGMLWNDTTSGLLKQRSTDNLTWITKGLIADTWQKLDAELTAISGLTSAADKVPYFTGSGTAAVATLTATGRALIDDADVPAQRATLGLGTIATQNSSAVAITGGSVTGITDLTVADGGTGASTAATARTNLGLGTAATANVTTSATDTTSGRLLKVGDFGLGGAGGAVVVDFNTLPESTYVNGVTGLPAILTSDTSTNGPAAGQYFYVQHIFYVTGNCIQIAWPYRSATGSMWHRTRATGVWSAWYKVYDQSNILGTVSGTYAAPTGAIIETGTNANGRYTKFADGTMIATHTITTGNVSTSFGAVYSSANVTWTYPLAFVAAPAVSAGGGGTGFWYGVSPDTASANVAAYTAVSFPSGATAQVSAIGRWQ